MSNQYYVNGVVVFEDGEDTYTVNGVTVSENVPALPGIKQLSASILVSGTLTALIDTSDISTDFLGTGNIAAVLTGTRQFTVDFSANGLLGVELDVKVPLTLDITASGQLTADLRENIEYLNVDFTGTGELTAEIDVPFHVGNTIISLSQQVEVTLVLALNVQNTLNLTQQLDLIFGQRSLTAQNVILFTHSVEVNRVLPVKTVSNTLTLTQSVVEARPVTSFLVLSQSAVGVISFLEGIANNTLALTQSVNTAGSVVVAALENTINLIQTVSDDLVKLVSLINTISFTQNVFGVVLASKTFVILQAPFDLIQTSVVLPNPLLDDNESLVSNLTLRRSMDNSIRTYVKTNNSRRIRYTFTLDRLKGLELEAFFDAYNGTDIRMINWKGQIWKVKLITNPLDFVQTGRYGPNSDRTDINLEFEGVILNG